MNCLRKTSSLFVPFTLFRNPPLTEYHLQVERARKIQRFMSQPFQVAQVFTGFEGKLVPLKESVRSFKEILSGQHDSLPESAFYMVGTIDDVKAKAEQLAKEMASSS